MLSKTQFKRCPIILYCACLLFGLSQNLKAEDTGKVIQANVVDAETKLPISGVNISIRGAFKNVNSDTNGAFSIVVSNKGQLQLTHADYETKAVDPYSIQNQTIILTKSKILIPLLNEINREKRLMTSSVVSISGAATENLPGTNRLNVLSGRLAGLNIVQYDGFPTIETSTTRIRGKNTIGLNTSTMVLVDGKNIDASQIDPYDIQSVTVLKDAAATALYGLRSSNGLILITTKRGQEGKIKINVHSRMTYQEPLSQLKPVNAYNYAMMYNLAQQYDGISTPKFNTEALLGYQKDSDQYKFPNVDKQSLYLKKNIWASNQSINISGGNSSAKFFVSANYQHDEGLFKTDETLNPYSTNPSGSIFGLHGNVDVTVNKYLKVNVDIRAKRDQRNTPGAYSSNYDQSLLNEIYNTPANAYTIFNQNGSLGGNSQYTGNIYGRLNKSGYSIWERSGLTSFVDLEYDLLKVLKGLRVKAYAGYNVMSDYTTKRSKSFAVWSLKTDGSGNYTQIGTDTQISGTGSGSFDQIVRRYDHGVSLHYQNNFGKHSLSAMLLADRQQIEVTDNTKIARNFQGIKGMIGYNYNNCYLFDFVIAHQGTELLPVENRYQTLPAASLAWAITEEPFLKNQKVVSTLKPRIAYGLNGNDVGSDIYYCYLSSFGEAGGYILGTIPVAVTGYQETRAASEGITSEEATKLNIGLDLGFLNDRFTASVDFFDEKNRNILIANPISSIFAGPSIYAPVGEVENQGYDMSMEWKDKIGAFEYNFYGNISHSDNTIVNQAEVLRAYPWMYRTGNSIDTRYGYVFDRYFTEDDFEIDGSLKKDVDGNPLIASQSTLGTVKPGYLKYVDLSGDGIIDENDQKAIGNGSFPKTFYGFGMGAKYSMFDFSIHFSGVAGIDKYYSGASTVAFNGQTGNVMEHHLTNYWTPNSGQSASYPRFTLTGTNDYVTSSYWQRDGSFVRLKSLEFGMSLPSKITNMLTISKARLFINGYNLLCWSNDAGFTDPEVEASGLGYPLMRSFSVGVNISF